MERSPSFSQSGCCPRMTCSTRCATSLPLTRQQLICLGNKHVALTICEDAWNDKHFWDRPLYGIDPVEDLIGAGGQILLNISASPFYLHKRELRLDMLRAIATKYRVPVGFVNQVGGNDSLVFDGSSFALGPDGNCHRASEVLRGRPGLLRHRVADRRHALAR